MTRSKLHKIFEDPPEGLTREELEAYVNDKLDPAAQHAVEARSLAGNLEAEALEGFEEHPEAFGEMGAMDSAWSSRLSRHQGSVWSRSIGRTVLAALTGGLLVLGYFALQPDAQIDEPVVVEQPVAELQEEEVAENFRLPESPVEETVQESKPEDPVAKAQPVAVDPEETTDPLEEQEAEPTPVEVAPSPMEQRTLPDPEPRTTKPIAPEENLNWEYIDRYKVYDYGEEYGAALKEERESPFRSVSARFESAEEQQHAAEQIQTITHQYSDVLELGIAHLDAHKYRKALGKFRLILAAHPDDLNGLFYGGFCYHHQRSYRKAVNYFNRVLEDPNPIFHEEARWYKALSLSYDGKWDLAKPLFQEIASGKGFYAEEARKQLHID